MTVLCYAPLLSGGFTNWDDDLYVTNNPLIREINARNLWSVATHPVAFNYHPLTIWTLQANYLLSGSNPVSYHATNLLLHVVNSLLVFVLFLRLTRGAGEAALLGAFLFAVHPMHVESVAWVSERKDVLYALFLLLALISYAGYAREGARRVGPLLVALLMTFLSLLSKPAAVAMPILLLAVDYFEGRRLLSRRVLVEKLPFVALSLVFGIITLRIQSDFVAVGALRTLGLPGRLLVACYGLMMYLVRFAFPVSLSAFYPYPDFGNGWPPAYLAAPVIVAAVAGLTLWSRRRTRFVATGMLVFLGSLVLVLQVVSIGLAVMADRYTYVAYLGLILIVAAGYAWALRAWRDRPGRVVGMRVVLAGLVAAMAVLAWQRVGVWRTSETLWSDVIAKYPGVGSAYIGRGVYRLKQVGDLEGAQRDLDRAVALAPDDYMSFYNRGILFQKRGDPARALADYTKAIAANPSKPEPYVNRAGVLAEQGRYDEASADYNRVIALDPDNPDFRFGWAAVFYKARRYEPALAEYAAGLRADPTRSEAWFFSGLCNVRLGRNEAALAAFDEAIKRDSSRGMYFLYRARCLVALGRVREGADDAQRARAMGETVEDSLLGRPQ